MTREEAILLLHDMKDTYDEIHENTNYEIGYEQMTALDMAIEALSADVEWIPCSERLPKKGEVVLITNGKGNVRCGQYRSEHDVRGETHYWWWKGKTIESVLVWQPLPTPYKGGDDK